MNPMCWLFWKIATSPDVTVKLDLTCWNKVFHVYPKLRITTTITGPTIRLVYPSTQYCSTHSYEIKGLRIYNTSNQELQQSSLVPISSILRLPGSTPSQTNCPAAAGCWKAFYQSFPARPGSPCRQARGESRLPRGESSPGISNDVVRNLNRKAASRGMGNHSFKQPSKSWPKSGKLGRQSFFKSSGIPRGRQSWSYLSERNPP